MKLIDGTPEAMKLINELKASGDLIDVYSEEYFKKRNDDEFNAESFHDLIKKHGEEFTHHLLVGCFHENTEKMMSVLELAGVNDSTNPILMRHNAPSFIFINLKNRTILCFGMWKRKAQTIESFLYPPNIGLDKNFELLDYMKVINWIREGQEEIARGIHPSLDGLSMGELDDLYKGKNGNYFYDEDEGNDVDPKDEDEGISQDEINERRSELDYAEEIKEEGEYQLQYFFPQVSLDYYYD